MSVLIGVPEKQNEANTHAMKHFSPEKTSLIKFKPRQHFSIDVISCAANLEKGGLLDARTLRQEERARSIRTKELQKR